MYSDLLCQLKANASAFPEGISLSSHPFIYRTLKSVHIIQHRYNCYVTICCCVCLGVEMTQVATIFLGIPLWKTNTSLSYKFNAMTSDDLMMQNVDLYLPENPSFNCCILFCFSVSTVDINHILNKMVYFQHARQISEHSSFCFCIIQ